VKKACGKKNPETQKVAGVPPSIHFFKKSTLSSRSLFHDANGLRERKPTFAQATGT